jgi:hypothetical protein
MPPELLWGRVSLWKCSMEFIFVILLCLGSIAKFRGGDLVG